MKTDGLSNRQLVAAIRTNERVDQALIDEYYRRCIPIYLDFIGIHWHTGFYLDDGEEACPEDQVRMIRTIAESIDLTVGERVLDVGCGIGGTPACLAEGYGVEAFGLTPVEDQRRIARSVAARLGVEERVRIELGHAGALPYPDGCFDAVLFFESPCHFPDRQAFFDEAHRVLKPGGRLAGEDWLATGTARDGDDKRWIEPICRSWAIPMLGTGDDYLAQLGSAGFEDRVYADMQSEMQLQKGFAVDPAQQQTLVDELRSGPDPLLALTLEGLLVLGRALAAQAFTIGRFSARKPASAG